MHIRHRQGLQLKHGIALVAALLLACHRHERTPASQGDAGPVAVPTALGTCADLAGCDAACQNGSADDCLAEGNHYSIGPAPIQDPQRALKLFERACALGSGPGCTFAGRIHEFGHGVTPDPGMAFSLYERACRKDYPGGCYNVAVMLERGQGAPRNEARAGELYRKVCAAGSKVACAAADRMKPRSR